MKKIYALKTSDDSPVLPRNKNKFVAVQGQSLWFQDEPNGWAAFTSKDQLRSLRVAYGGEILEFNRE